MTFTKPLETCFTLAILALMINSCTNKNTSSSFNDLTSTSYYSEFSPEFKIYHRSNDSSELHLKINSSELLYSRANPTSKFQSVLEITGVIKDQEGNFIDSLETGFSNSEQVPLDQILYSKTKFKLPENTNYTLHLTYIDSKRKIKGTKNIRINKTNRFTEENFLVFTSNSKFPKFSTHCPDDFPIKIFSDRVDLSQVKTSSRDAESTLPPPPYSKSQGVNPDISNFQDIKLTQTENELIIENIEISDIYLHQEQKGLIFLVRPKSFPTVTTSSELIMPMRYISSKREFEKMSESANLKSDIDEFWLECGTSKDRTKVLISSYYQRVNYSNLHFSSFKSGWRTDRGLIYIIYGHPNEVIFKSDYETWIYEGQNALGSVEFKFNKAENSFSTNHYTLERNPLYKSEWSRRVNAWRNGRIYD